MNNLVKQRGLLKWGIYSLLLLLFYVLQTTPAALSIAGVKPMLLIPLAVCAACFEQPLSSGIFGLFCGLFTDAAAGYLLGFNALILMLSCVIISLIHTNFLKSKLLNTLISGLCVLLIQRMLDYFFYYSIWGLDPSCYILLHQILPCAGYSLALCVPIFYLSRLLFRKLQKEDADLKIEP